MNTLFADLGLTIAAFAAFFVPFALAVLYTRAAGPRAAAATPDLSDEPPAVVNLLTNGWRLNEDAAEATLLDLAARRYLELRQPGSDPNHTTVHLRDAAPGDLTPYESRVLDRVRALAKGGVVPVSALTFRDPREAAAWEGKLRREVIADARARGLSRRRFGGVLVIVLELCAVLAVVGVTYAAIRWMAYVPPELAVENRRGGSIGDAIPYIAGGALVFCNGFIGAILGERDTRKGRAAASRWLGVRRWLRGHQQFGDLPPAAVTVWDRYLAYGAALGTTHVASAVLDVGMGDRTLVWSSFGGSWHRVRVRYPRFGRHLGRRSNDLLRGAFLSLAFGVGFVWLYTALRSVRLSDTVTTDQARELDRWGVPGAVAAVGLVLGILLLVRGAYWGIAALADLGGARTVTGEVLWNEPRTGVAKPGVERPQTHLDRVIRFVREMDRRTRSSRRRAAVPERATPHYLAIDDGTGNRTRAWLLPQQFADRCLVHDVVRVRVRPWTRLVVDVQPVRDRAQRQRAVPSR